MTRPFLILIVIDGFGCRKERESNAIAEADSPVFERLFRESILPRITPVTEQMILSFIAEKVLDLPKSY